MLEDVGMPHEQIELQAQRYDLILMGQEQTRFHFETRKVTTTRSGASSRTAPGQ